MIYPIIHHTGCRVASTKRCCPLTPHTVHDSTVFRGFFFWPHHAACEILAPQPGIEPEPPALEVQSLNHWTTREVP